jgi:hypothetical protein
LAGHPGPPDDETSVETDESGALHARIDRGTLVAAMPKGEPSFGRDLRTSAAAWVRYPWLPVVSMVLTLTTTLFDGPVWPVGLLAVILYAGWLGTERICYLKAFRGRPVSIKELWRMTLSFAPRYAVLGAVVAVLITPASIMLAATAPADGSDPDLDGFLLYASVVGLVIGVTFTFIAPALAFTTRRVRQASRIGLRMIRTEWPACWGYVLVPPLVGFAIVRSVGPWGEADLASRLVTLTCGPLLNLWFKGATASFYLRRWETGDDGAAFTPRVARTAEPHGSGEGPV